MGPRPIAPPYPRLRRWRRVQSCFPRELAACPGWVWPRTEAPAMSGARQDTHVKKSESQGNHCITCSTHALQTEIGSRRWVTLRSSESRMSCARTTPVTGQSCSRTLHAHRAFLSNIPFGFGFPSALANGIVNSVSALGVLSPGCPEITPPARV